MPTLPHPEPAPSLIQIVQRFLHRLFPTPQAVALTLLLAAGFLAVVMLADMLMPVFAALVIAYLLEGPVSAMERRGVPRLAAVIIVFVAFMALLLFTVIALLPLLYQQLAQLAQQLPNMVTQGLALLNRLPELYPEFISQSQINELIATVRQEFILLGQRLLTYSYASVVNLIAIVVYVILVPLLVFFFLKDKDRILAWFKQYLPKDIHLTAQVWRNVDAQIGNYIRGKVIEILIVFGVSFLTFSLLRLNYALLLSVLVGLSVIIPYIGATVVTFPVLIVAYFQWGLNDSFWYVTIAYFVIQALDGMVLVPILFSEVVNLHPVAIIVAILFFGGLWGFWGVFFAIPLATLVEAVLSAWPREGCYVGQSKKGGKPPRQRKRHHGPPPKHKKLSRPPAATP
ncbi:putative permease [Methylomarinovum caldicuralii]|uniref:Permease n=1 Tax=Methylomarinovum caldicuralii TaxID=438856 RepID=A0AAU9C6W0_9GAMM|nr:AI-2E family transporter [Methylomarinovum caldicuralii]BCX82944.1 putative permease [Methylomarinovum caldicuralii]